MSTFKIQNDTHRNFADLHKRSRNARFDCKDYSVKERGEDLANLQMLLTLFVVIKYN